jgi:predicted 3-demethylubiquinone-9 3-methyltransferase (glyoxalase superfamily)
MERSRLYVSLVPDSSVNHILHSPGDWPGGEAGDVIMVTFTLGGQSFQALNGGAPANYGTAASISVECADQAEVDRLWTALTGDGGSETCAVATRQVGRALANRPRDPAASPGRP